ncbi:MAG: hypothetical protein QOH25_471 [Acidobacteriota bacterium]|jgi:hypothetical protein|nr:hypothetical protein [Acidobacteriota bacterium]
MVKKIMGEKEALQSAADEARKSARTARELGGHLDNYAKYLMQPGRRERADELHGLALNRLATINDGLVTCEQLVIESGRLAVALVTVEVVVAGEVSAVQKVPVPTQRRAVQVQKRMGAG